MKLRQWQRRLVKKAVESTTATLVVAPTGSGKTVIATQIAKAELAKDPNARVLFVAHRRELVEQAAKRCAEWGLGEPSIIGAGLDRSTASRVTVASVYSLARRTYPEASVLIIDEAHHVAAATWDRVYQHYEHVGAKIYGMTATPVRLDDEPLGEWFDTVVQAPSTAELAKLGHIVIPRIWVPKHAVPDLRNVKRNDKDFDRSELSKAVRDRHIVGDVVAHWERFGGGLPTVVYAVDKAHGEALRERFDEVDGVRCSLLTDETPDSKRERILGELAIWRPGSFWAPVVVNCSILTEGWDCPAAKCVVMARPTMSVGLVLQMIGRVTRPSGDVPRVLDLAGNYRYHDESGALHPDHVWSIEDGRIEIGKPNVQREPRKVCPECGELVESGTQRCGCGFAFPEDSDGDESRTVIEVEGALEEFFPTGGRLSRAQLRQLDELITKRKHTCSEIAKIVGCNRTTVLNRAKALGVTLPHPNNKLTDEQYAHIDRLIREGKHTSAEIAKIVGCDGDTVWRRAKALGVTLPSPTRLTDEQYAHIDRLIREGKHTRGEIAGIVGCSYKAVQRRAKALGVTLPRTRST